MLDTSKIYTSNNYGKFKVINYTNSQSVTIEFILTGYSMISTSANIRRGEVKDKFFPFVYGVGFLGVGDYEPSINGKRSRIYQTWKGMLERCYCQKYHKKNQTYTDCETSREWCNFQNFAKWYDDNYVQGFELDKDMLIDGNKVYSPITCRFISHNDNVIKAHAKNYRFISPSNNIVNIYNLAEFCRDNNLTQSSMSSVHLGKRKHHKGWVISK